MRRDDDIGQVPVRTRRVERLAREHVERGAAEPAVSQRLDNRHIVDQLAARDVHEQRASFDPIQLATADDLLGVGRVRQREDDDVALREELVELVGRQHFVDAVDRRAGGAPANRRDAHAEGSRQPGDRGSDRSEADDAEARTVQKAHNADKLAL